VQILERAGLDGHTVLAREVVLAAVPLSALEDACSAGTVVADDRWVALDQVATAEDALADEVVGLASQGRLALVLGEVPAAADVYAVPHAHRLTLEELAGALQQAPPDVPVVVAGDPDELAGRWPGAPLRDLLEWGALPVRDLRPDPADGPTLGRLSAAVRRGQLLPPEPDDHSLVVVPCTDDEEVVRRASQLVADSIPRVFGGVDILVLTPLRRGTAGQVALAEALPGVEVVTVHEGVGRRAGAVVACFPGQAAGVLSRSLVYSCVVRADRHLSVLTAAADALPTVVARGMGARRNTRLRQLLLAGAADDSGPGA
jgi:hypothetical protein